MRIAIVSPYDPRPSAEGVANAAVGGVEEALRHLAEALAARGDEVTILATSRPRLPTATANGVRYVTVRRWAALFRAPLSLLPFRLPREADVVHVPATYPTVSDLVPLLRRVRGRPTVLEYHFTPVATSRAMNVAVAMYERTLGRAAFVADRVVVKSEDYARAVPLLADLPSTRTRVVPNGVDLERFDVDAQRGTEILFVGRLIPYKGVDVLLEAMRHVQDHAEAPLVLAGAGPLREALEGRARALRLDARFLGYVPHADLPRLYAKARLTVLPSVNRQEAFGMTLLESMATGTPVVASDLPGVREVASHGGATARAGDPADLARVILESLKRDPPSRTALRARLASTYAWPVVARRMRDVYEEAIRGAP